MGRALPSPFFMILHQSISPVTGHGNLNQRCDANRDLAENFGYDDLNRLTRSTVYSDVTVSDTGNPPCTGGSATSSPALAFTYDSVGNIQQKIVNGVTSQYSYADTTTHPYAVTWVTNVNGGTYSASYDADGNMTTRNGYAITWTVDNLPSNISSAEGGSTFSYGPDGNRYAQSATFNGNTTNTTYIGGLFEVVSTSTTTEYRHNIMADGQIVAVHVITQSGNAYTDYLHADHLGSVDAITDDQGSVIQTMSFDAFGQRRDPTNWDYDLGETTIATLKNYTDRGYTDQEELDNLSLVDLNGRVYDPTVGRFISADPIMGDNRYAYMYDNPLAGTDPSGYCGFCLSTLTNPVTVLTGIPMPSNTAQNLISQVGQALAHPSIMFEDTSPIVGHYVNNMMARSGTMQEVGSVAAMVVSYWFGPEVYAGYESYITDINGGTPIEDAEAYGVGYLQGMAADGLMHGAVTAYNSGPWGMFGFGMNQVGNMEFRQIAAHYANDHGMSLTEFDLALEGLSFVGYGIYGSDLHPEGSVDYMSGWTTRGYSALPFDIVDTALELQGIPSATGWDYIVNGNGTPLVGHSLGALTANNMVALGAAPSALLYALPIVNFATGGTSLTTAWGDPVAGFGIEGLINGSQNISNGFGHSACGEYNLGAIAGCN